jgi:eukaryotic-like serine/threonine-protein kinase
VSLSLLELDPDPDLVIGELVGEYRIEGKLGRGAFGTVFRATHPVIGKLVAIKVLARRYSVEPEMVKRFVTEARAVNQISHRNIIDIFSFGQLPDGRAYYVMELLEGETLHSKLMREGKIALAEAISILRPLARALDAAHAKGIAHRDLKPDNIFLATDPDGEVHPKLLDFGIAKLFRAENTPHKTQTGIAMGTALYMSPEQCHGRDVDHRTDYYAFGVLAYQMLTGAVPIDGDDPMAIMMKQLSYEPPAPSSRVPELPTTVDDAIAWLMRKDPDNRPPSLIVAVRAFDGAPETAPGHRLSARTAPGAIAPPATGVTPTSSRTASLVFLAVAVVVGGAAYAVMHATRATTSTPAAPTVVAQAPVPTAPTTPATPPTTPVLTTTVTLHVDGPPTATVVTAAGRAVGMVPGDLQLPRGTTPIELRFDHAGYALATTTVVPDHDDRVTVTLKRRATAAAAVHTDKPDPHSIENPFDKAP